MGILDRFSKPPNVEELKEKKDFKGLTKALRNKSVGHRAVGVLIEMGEGAVEPLINAFRGYGAKNLSIYASILIRIGEPAVQPLIEALLRDRGKIRDVRRQAAMALAEIGDERAVKPLCWAREKEPTMTGAREFLIPALRKIAKPSYQALLEALKDSNKDTRSGAIDTLNEVAAENKLNANAVEPLSQALKDKDRLIRMRAAKALGAIGDARAIEPLIQTLKDEDVTVRQNAAYALGYIYDERVIDTLKMALKDSSWFVRDAAKASLKQVQEKLSK